jgi:hypothetical protein
VAIEILEYLDRDLSPVVHSVAELCSGQLTICRVGGDVLGDADHLRDGVLQKKMVGRDFNDLALASQRFEHAADVRFRRLKKVGEVATARRAEAIRA